MATTADFKNGLCLEYNHDLYTIVEFQHVKPGKGPAFVRTKLKSLTSGKVIENTFSAGHKVVTARIERRPHQYLYKDELGYHLMDSSTFEQTFVPEGAIENADLMKEGQAVDVLYHAEKEEVIGSELPQFVELTVTYTEPGLKGDTATNATKKATLETEAEINVPLFINEGDKIKIETTSRSYYERVKE
ncbi:elongation factor P [Fulvivirga lutimaris]|uniref:elongation factor P n=1 Tax=Fulvivirga lutimaris TaxID=1819566 RepID=UPI0012BC3DDE|nr:elongation factor P [Fulvivirga lutimaris]MTI40148.1 elongation factor P [Fulvivirga lutimaris]